MTDRPILFYGPMVKALLSGQKSQTRRIAKGVPPQPEASCHERHTQKHPAPYLDAYCSGRKSPENPRGMGQEWCWWQVDDRQCLPTFKAPCVPGDRLWVREAWQVRGLAWGAKPRDTKIASKDAFHYRATDNGAWKTYWGGWRPSLHMPRWASRITLAVTDVRIQRLHDITDEDSIAEGATSRPNCSGFRSAHPGWSMDWSRVGAPSKFGKGGALTEACISLQSPKWAFGSLWNDINGLNAWEANPWVWAISFSVIRGNIDKITSEAA